MNRYMMNFPRGVKVDVFNPPEDFDEQIRKSFADYTEGTSKDYTYVDKLAYIDLMNEYAHGKPDSTDRLEDVYNLGRLNLYDKYGDDHHIYDKVMQLLVRAIKVVIDYEK